MEKSKNWKIERRNARKNKAIRQTVFCANSRDRDDDNDYRSTRYY